MAPNVVFERRDVEVADQDRAAGGDPLGGEPFRHLVDQGELVGELVVDRRIRLVAAGGNEYRVISSPLPPPPSVTRIWRELPLSQKRRGIAATIGSP